MKKRGKIARIAAAAATAATTAAADRRIDVKCSLSLAQ